MHFPPPWRMLSCVFALAVVGTLSAADPKTLAQVYDHAVTSEEVTQAINAHRAPDNADYLGGIIIKAMYDRFAQEQNLEPTLQECQQFNDFQRRSQQHDLELANRDVGRLHNELAHDELPQQVRAATTERLKIRELFAKNMAQAVQYPPPEDRANQMAESWVRGFKIRKALYEKFGGVVEVTKFGQRPAGAEKFLFEQEIKNGKIVIPDAALAAKVEQRFDPRPDYVATPDQIDFSYYWTRPLPETQ